MPLAKSVIRAVQAFFANAAPSNVRLSEELLRDRRAEAAAETVLSRSQAQDKLPTER